MIATILAVTSGLLSLVFATGTGVLQTRGDKDARFGPPLAFGFLIVALVLASYS